MAHSIKPENGLTLISTSTLTKRGRERANALANTLMDCLFDAQQIPYSTIISGGYDTERTAALLALLSRCPAGKLPVFILHAHNRELQQRLASQHHCVYLPKTNEYCTLDLLASFRKPEMVTSILYDTARRTSNCSIQLQRALRFGLELIARAGEPLSLQNICTFPWGNIGIYIRNHQNQLDAIEAMGRLGSLENGAAEADVFVSQLKNMPLPFPQRQTRVLGLKECLSNGARVCLDIVSDSNRMLTELLLSTLYCLRGQGYPFLTVIDSFPQHPDSLLAELLANRDRRTPTVYLSPDCTAVRGMEESELHSMLGSPLNLLLFSHMNGNSAEALSQFFGEHDDVNITKTSGTNKDSLALIRKTVSEGVSFAETRRRNILPESFRNLARGVALVFPARAERAYMPISFANGEIS